MAQMICAHMHVFLVVKCQGIGVYIAITLHRCTALQICLHGNRLLADSMTELAPLLAMCKNIHCIMFHDAHNEVYDDRVEYKII